MKLVIDIPEEDYEMLVYTRNTRPYDIRKSDKVILDGKPLPKGHGRLIDADNLKGNMIEYGWHHIDSTVTEYIDGLPTVIEADGGE